jgi:hypothetical protein
MKYSLIFHMAVTEAIAEMPEIPHELFTLACLDIAGDPLGRGGFTINRYGLTTIRAWVVGSMGFIRYEVDEGTGVINLTNILTDLA